MTLERAPIIEVRDVGFSYPEAGVPALRGVNLTIREGEVVALVGQNGAGKTTLAKLFNGLLAPTQGEVVIRGQSTRKAGIDILSRIVGYCYQNPDHQIFSNTVRQEVAFGLKNHGVPKAEIEAKVHAALEMVGMEGEGDRYPFLLGRGERQKLAVASILALGPPVLVVDEPTTGLDLRGTRNIMELLSRLSEAGRTIVIITHDMNVVAEYAPRTVVMMNGAVILDGPTRAVLTDERALRSAFLKPPQITRVALRLHERAEGFAREILTVPEFIAEFRRLAGSGDANTASAARDGGS